MKKTSLFILGFILGLSMISISASATLYDYYVSQGQNLPPVSERVEKATLCGIDDYRGTEGQNGVLEACLRGNGTEIGLLGSTLPIAGNTYNLSGSGIYSSASSITLQSLTIKQTGYKLVDADFSDVFYITLEPGSNSRQEIASCTTVTQNAAGTATLSGCSRGLLPFSPYTASTTYDFAHAGGTQVIFSDPPQLFNQLGYLDGNNTWSKLNIFGTSTGATTQFIQIGTSTPSYFENIAGVLYYHNYGQSAAAIGGGANTYSFIRPLITSGNEVKFASSTYWFTYQDLLFANATSTIYNPNTAILGLKDFTEPFSSSTNDRYISNSTSTGSVSTQLFYNQYIYTRATNDWTTTTPTNLMSVWNIASSTFELFSTTGVGTWTAINTYPDYIGFAKGTGLEDWWNNRYNATNTKELLTFTTGSKSANATTTGSQVIGSDTITNASSTLTVIGNAKIQGNATTTGNFNIDGQLCFSGAGCQGKLSGFTYSDFTVATTSLSTGQSILATSTMPAVAFGDSIEIFVSGNGNAVAGSAGFNVSNTNGDSGNIQSVATPVNLYFSVRCVLTPSRELHQVESFCEEWSDATRTTQTATVDVNLTTTWYVVGSFSAGTGGGTYYNFNTPTVRIFKK